MKAEVFNKRPEFKLMKQNDIITHQHLQYPRWLDEDARYADMGLEFKMTYMYLFNRFRLSQNNGWVNDSGEVFVIYTREELARLMHIGEKRVTVAMNVLKERKLIWERRCGRGFANQIYLSKIEVSLSDAVKSRGGPLNPLTRDERNQDYITEQPRPAKMTGLGFCADAFENTSNAAKQTINADTISLSLAEAREQPFLNRQNDGSRTVETAVQEPSNRLPSNIDFSKKENDLKSSQPMSVSFYSEIPISGVGGTKCDRLTDEQRLDAIFDQADLECFEENDITVIKDAIERLYFSESIRVDNAIYPNERIRSHLLRLDCFIVQDALCRYARNSDKITNSGAYVTKVLFNTIMEAGSALIIDPYLNLLNSQSAKSLASGGDRGP